MIPKFDGSGTDNKAGFAEHGGERASRTLTCRIRYFTDGVILGSQSFVESHFYNLKEKLGYRRRPPAGCGPFKSHFGLFCWRSCPLFGTCWLFSSLKAFHCLRTRIARIRDAHLNIVFCYLSSFSLLSNLSLFILSAEAAKISFSDRSFYSQLALCTQLSETAGRGALRKTVRTSKELSRLATSSLVSFERRSLPEKAIPSRYAR